MYLSCASQLNFRFSGIGPPCLCLCVSHWIGVVAGLGPVPVSLNAIMTAVDTWTATWFTISLMPSQCAISNWLLMLFYWLCYYGELYLPYYEISTPNTMLCYWHSMQEQNVVAYTTLLTVWLQVCFWMNVLWSGCTTCDYDLYIQLAYLCAWFILIIIYDPLGHQYYTNTYMHDVIYIDGGTLVLCGFLSLHKCKRYQWLIGKTIQGSSLTYVSNNWVIMSINTVHCFLVHSTSLV